MKEKKIMVDEGKQLWSFVFHVSHDPIIENG
jgi:hypothetical protein